MRRSNELHCQGNRGSSSFSFTSTAQCDLPKKSTSAEAAACPREATMDLHAPSMWLFVVSVLIALLSIVSTFTPIQYVTQYAFWVAIIAFIVLAFGNLVKT
jgi:hypothetical protein